MKHGTATGDHVVAVGEQIDERDATARPGKCHVDRNFRRPVDAIAQPLTVTGPGYRVPDGIRTRQGSASRGPMAEIHETADTELDVDLGGDGPRPSFTLNLSAFAGSVAAESLSRRVKALACTAPLHALESNKGRAGEGGWARLNCWELAFVAIDAVAVAMDFDTGASYDRTVELLTRQVARQDPTLGSTMAGSAAQWIVEGLISGRGGDEPFHAAYGRWDDAGDYEARGFHVELLTEHQGAGGEIYLRASDEAINVLIGALDTDIESAAEAVDAKMDSLVKRGMWGEAVQAAEHARYQSIRYAEQIRRDVVATRQNVAEVDWVERIPALIDRALAHVAVRYRTERTIIANVTHSRDEATDPSLRAKASQMLQLLKDCEARHEALQRKLIGVRVEFRDATRDLLARPVTSVSLVDLERQILVPILEAPLRTAGRPVEGFFARITSPAALVADLDRLVTVLCRPPRDNGEDDGDLDAPDLVDIRREPRFDDRTWDAAEAILANCDRPTRLSALLARAEETEAGDVAHLVALLAVRAVDPGLGHRLAASEATMMLAVDDDSILDHPRFAGADLLVTPCERRTDDDVAARSQAREHV